MAGATAYYYRSIHYELSFEYPPGKAKLLVAGTEYTLEAQNAKREDPTLTNADLLAELASGDAPLTL